MIEFDIVSEDQIKKMLEDLDIKYGNTYDTELSETSTNAVQNQAIAKKFKKLDAELEKKANQTEVDESVEELDKKISKKVDKVSGKGLSTNDFDNEYKVKLDNLNSSLNNTLSSAKSYTNSEIIKVDNKINSEINRAKTSETNLSDRIDDLEEGLTNAFNEAKEYTDSEVKNNTNKINILNGTGEGSVKKTVKDEIAKVVDGAPEQFNTLKEISEYLNSHEDVASGLVESITRLETEKVSKEDIDSALSNESENPVQNKVVTEKLTELSSVLSHNTFNLFNKETLETHYIEGAILYPNGKIEDTSATAYGIVYCQALKGKTYHLYCSKTERYKSYANAAFSRETPLNGFADYIISVVEESGGAEVDVLYTALEDGYISLMVWNDTKYYIEQTTSEKDLITREKLAESFDLLIGELPIAIDKIGWARAGEEVYEGTLPESYRMSDYIDISFAKTLVATVQGNGVINTISFFDKDRQYIESLSIREDGLNSYLIDFTTEEYKEVVYVTIGIATTNPDNCFAKLVGKVGEEFNRVSAEMDDLSDAIAEAERALNIQPTEVLLDKAFLSGYITGTGYFLTINQGTPYGLYYIPVKKGKTYRAVGMYAKLEASYAGITFCEVLPTTAGSYGAIVLEKVGNATPIDYQYVADKDGYLYVFIYDSTGYVNFFGYKPKTTFNAEYVENNALKTEAAIFNKEFSFISGEALRSNGDVWENLDAKVFARTDYIDVKGYQYLSYQLGSNEVVYNICFYDDNKLFLQSIRCPSGLNTSFIDLSEYRDAKYIRCSTADFEYYRDTGNLYVRLMAYPRKPSQYMKMLNIGDSLTRTSRWAIHVCDYCHIPAYSQKASSGATMALKGSDSIYQAVQALTAEEDIDLVTIWAGTNDFGSSVDIGDFDAQANAATRDVTTFYGAYMASVEKVLSLYPKARIILIGTTPRTWANGEGDYNTTTIGRRYLREYVDAVKKIAEWYGLPFLDLLRTSGINSKNIAEYMYPQTGSDGTYYLHFSDYGTEQIAKRIAAFIESVG